jgi:hypothetical protein
MDQIIDTITEIDFEQLKIDIAKHRRELETKNQMLVVYKRLQSDTNMALNTTKVCTDVCIDCSYMLLILAGIIQDNSFSRIGTS